MTQEYKTEPEHQACSECGSVLPAWRMIRTAAGSLCPDCHAASQLAKEPVESEPSKYYGDAAGFWIRAVARVLDLVVVGLLIAGVWAGMTFFKAPELWLTVAVSAIPVLYFTVTVGVSSTTPGKRICGLSMTNSRGYRVGFFRAFWRFVAENLGLAAGAMAILFLVPEEELRSQISSWNSPSPFRLLLIPCVFFTYLIVLINPKKRGLHDYLAGTRVIKG